MEIISFFAIIGFISSCLFVFILVSALKKANMI